MKPKTIAWVVAAVASFTLLYVGIATLGRDEVIAGVDIQLLVIGGVAGVFVTLMAINLRRSHEQRMAAEAHRLGLRFSAEDRLGIAKLPMPLFSTHPGKVRCVMRGDWKGLPATAFEYEYEGGRGRGAVKLTCVLVATDALMTPASILSQQFPEAVERMLGIDGAAFESEEFNRRFRVDCDDAEFAHSLIDQRMMDWLLSLDDGWAFETAATSILCRTSLKQPWETDKVLGMAKEFHDRIPDAFWSRFASG